MYRNILLATDGSVHSLVAAKKAAQIAKKFGATIHVLHVSPSIHLRLEPATDEQRKIGDEQTRRALNVLKRTKAVLDRHDAKAVVRGVEFGHPANVICRIAEAESFNLIIMGSRGVGEVKSLLFGSVSASVSANAECSVLIVR